MGAMNRRHVLLALSAGPVFAAPARSQLPQPYKVSLFASGSAEAGLLVELEPGWKTYWKMPGEAGIPPQFDWAGSRNLESVEVMYPVPGRFQDLSGETVGYHDQVVFPLLVRSKNAAEPVSLKLDLFFAVCKDVCIPASSEMSLDLKSTELSPLLELWKNRVPRADVAIVNARMETKQEIPMLVLALNRTVADIFVESETAAYFGKPQFDVSPGEAWLPIAGMKDLSKLRAASLKVTLSLGDSGIEQVISVD
jgi:DsbC/DsbD-like thiol-disulfide interchange protein